MICLLFMAFVCAAALILRRAIWAGLKENETVKCKRWPVRLNRHHNYGMAGGRLKAHPRIVTAAAFLAVGAVAAALAFAPAARKKKAIRAGLALALGGGLSNLLERIQNGYVTDYLQFEVPFARIRNLVFNLADLCIFAGSMLVIAGSFGKRR